LEEGETMEGKEFGFLEVILKGENLVRVEDTEKFKGITDSILWRICFVELPHRLKYLYTVVWYKRERPWHVSVENVISCCLSQVEEYF